MSSAVFDNVLLLFMQVEQTDIPLDLTKRIVCFDLRKMPGYRQGVLRWSLCPCAIARADYVQHLHMMRTKLVSSYHIVSKSEMLRMLIGTEIRLNGARPTPLEEWTSTYAIINRFMSQNSTRNASGFELVTTFPLEKMGVPNVSALIDEPLSDEVYAERRLTFVFFYRGGTTKLQ